MLIARFEVLDLLLGFVARDAVRLSNPCRKACAATGNKIEVTRGEPPPVCVHLTSESLPGGFHELPVHVSLLKSFKSRRRRKRSLSEESALAILFWTSDRTRGHRWGAIGAGNVCYKCTQAFLGADHHRRFLIIDGTRIRVAAEPKVSTWPAFVFVTDVARAHVARQYEDFNWGVKGPCLAPSHNAFRRRTT